MHIPNVLQQNTRHVPGQGQEAVEGRNTAVRLRGVSNHPVHHCCDKHPRTRAGVTTCPAQLITNQDVLQTSQMATPKVNQNVTFKTPEFKKKKINPNPKKARLSNLRGKANGVCTKFLAASGWKAAPLGRGSPQNRQQQSPCEANPWLC